MKYITITVSLDLLFWILNLSSTEGVGSNKTFQRHRRFKQSPHPYNHFHFVCNIRLIYLLSLYTSCTCSVVPMNACIQIHMKGYFSHILCCHSDVCFICIHIFWRDVTNRKRLKRKKCSASKPCNAASWKFLNTFPFLFLLRRLFIHSFYFTCFHTLEKLFTD